MTSSYANGADLVKSWADFDNMVLSCCAQRVGAVGEMVQLEFAIWLTVHRITAASAEVWYFSSSDPLDG